MAKTCANCNNKIGMLTGKIQLNDKQFICQKCFSSTDFSSTNISDIQTMKNMSLEQFKDLYNEKKALSALPQKERFHVTSYYGDLELDENKQLFRLRGIIYKFNQLGSYNLVENGSSVTSGGLGIGRAVVGGVIAGPVGAIIGGVTKQKKHTDMVENLSISISFKNAQPNTQKLTYIYKKQAKDQSYEKALLKAKETLSGFDTIVASMASNEPNSSIKETEISGADEIRKFKELLDDGIITQEEFYAKKKELLGL